MDHEIKKGFVSRSDTIHCSRLDPVYGYVPSIPGGTVSLQAAWQIPLAFMGIAFVGFSLARFLTGRDFMIHSAKGWLILEVLINVSLMMVVILGVSLGLEDSLLPYGIWPYAGAFVLVGLLTWGSYRASRRYLDNGEDV